MSVRSQIQTTDETADRNHNVVVSKQNVQLANADNVSNRDVCDQNISNWVVQDIWGGWVSK